MANEHCWSDWGIDNDLVQFHEKLLKKLFTNFIKCAIIIYIEKRKFKCINKKS